MGHIFILCGPPGSGKTTLLKMIDGESLALKQLQRITTRPRRVEEGDKGNVSLEYEFLNFGEFTGRLAHGKATNFVEWNQHFYATDVRRLEQALGSSDDYILHEDMPSAIHLKRQFGSNVTTLLLFTDDRDELLNIEFATATDGARPSILEWRRRLGLKYDESVALRSGSGSASDRDVYIQSKMRRALPDLAFMAGRIGDGEDICVIPNRQDAQCDALASVTQIIEAVRQKKIGNRQFAFVLMPFGDRRLEGSRQEQMDFDKLYRFVIKPAVEEEGIACWRGDEISDRRDILEDVIDHIEAAQYVVADLSGGNANVFLELGMCLKLGKETILISRDDDHAVPFNTRNLRRIPYEDSARGWQKLHEDIRNYRRGKKRPS